ncbi:acyltransferase 3 [Cladorrhinum samala]|uniref:Acyltransferase 3 n=1 Tax=Cladorrhinum samala TaxID=585594 RepID=A0AAV9I1V6_9PEZI|nr:acyltransferase 3 [Cladorrhinum samala]
MRSLREGILDGNGVCVEEPRRLGKLGAARWSALSVKSVFRGLRQLVWPKPSVDGAPRQLRPTAYLDGLRGFAAFLVYIHHNELWAHGSLNLRYGPVFENAFGWQDEFHLATFYGIRNFFSGGHMAVATFYVISGYVLSVKPLALIQAGEHLKLLDNLASAFFRRFFRLYIPLVVTCFLFATSWHVFGYWNFATQPKDTYAEELWNLYNEFKNFSFLFKEGDWVWVSYNVHLWSIPLEMRGSIVTFTACLALCRGTTKARLLCEAALVYYFLYIVDAYYCALFIAGMLQCDLDLLARRDGYFPGFLRRLERYKTFIYYHLFLLSMYLAGVPSGSNKIEDLRANPGWYYLSFLKPQAVFNPKWFYLFIASNMMVACIPRLGWLKRFFESRFCQYLGRISFSLYLVHGPVLNVIGDRIYHAVGWTRKLTEDHPEKMAAWANKFPLPMSGPLGLEPAFLLPQLILIPLTFWIADVVTRTVDEPTVKFTAWMYKRIQGGDTPEPKPVDRDSLLRLA